MKTFEERYTAWIDGQLAGETLSSFERELARRAATGDEEPAETDRTDALQLRALLKEHLQAPALTNTEFFNHQMCERIDAEIDRAARRREASVRPAFRLPAFVWPFLRVAGVGAACLFVAGALYYGMVPSRQDAGRNVAAASPAPGQTPGQLAANNDSPVPPPASTDRPADNQFVKLNTPAPTPVDLNDDIHVVTPQGAGNNTPATPLHYDKANVLWVDGLNYLPSVTGAASPAPSATPAAAAPAAAAVVDPTP